MEFPMRKGKIKIKYGLPPYSGDDRSDTPTTNDQLNFSDYCRSVSERIAKAVEEKSTPLTIGIYGEWGSGKTTFMLIVDRILRKEYKIEPIWFNAWKYDEEKNLWAALVQRVLDQAEVTGNWLERAIIKIKIWWSTLSLGSGIIDIFRQLMPILLRFIIVLFSIYMFIGLTRQELVTFFNNLMTKWFDQSNPNTSVFIARMTRILIVIIGIIAAEPLKLLKLFSFELGIDFSKMRSKPSYREYIAFLDKFHSEFETIVRLISKDKPLVIIIDDLDRCLPVNSLQVLEAIKLFLDAKGCVFVLAVDRYVVEKAVMHKHRELFPVDDKEQTNIPSAFEQGYIEKIIQLPIRVPPVTKDQIITLIKSLYDDYDVIQCAELFASGLPTNPRKVKRAVQLFVFYRNLAKNRFLEGEIKPYLLARLVILQSQYRQLFENILQKPDLLLAFEINARDVPIESVSGYEDRKVELAALKNDAEGIIANNHYIDQLFRVEVDEGDTFNGIKLESFIFFLGQMEKIGVRDVSFEHKISGDVLGPMIEKASSPGPSIPLQLPPRTEHFINREKELELLLNSLRPGSTVAIFGPGGIGKSALAGEVLYQLTEDGKRAPLSFPDGILFHSFDHQPESSLAFEAFALAYDEEPAPNPFSAAQRALSRRKAIIVLDSAENADDITEVLRVRGSCAILMTTRDRAQIINQEKSLELGPFESQSAMALLRAWGGIWVDDLSAAEQVCSLVGYLPLALRLAGHYLTVHNEPIGQYAKWLEATPIEVLNHRSRGFESIPVLLSHSLEQISSDAKTVLSVIGLLALAPIQRYFVSAALMLDDQKIGVSLNELVRYGFLNRFDDLYQVSHSLIRIYARDRLTPPDTALPALVDALATQADEENQSGLPERFIPLRPHLRVVAELAEKSGLDKAGALWNELGYHLMMVAEYTGAQEAFERALAIDEAAYGPEHPKVATAVNNLGRVLKDLGDLAGAREAYERALAIDEAASGPEHPNVARDVNNLGLVLRDLGDLAGAREAYERALAIWEKALGPDHPNVASAVNNLGSVLQDLGDLAGAREAYERALAIDEAAFGPEHPNIARDLNNLGSVLHAQGDLMGAREAFERALAIDEAAYGSEHPTIARGVNNLGMVLMDLGDLSGAQEAFKRALAINEAAFGPEHPEVAIDVNNLGMVLYELGQVDEALGYYKQALNIAQQNRFRIMEGLFLDNLGLAYSDLGQVERAIEYYQQALAIAQEIGDRRKVGALMGKLGYIYRDLGRVEQAREYLKQAYDIFVEIKSPDADQALRDLESLDSDS
jgi:tetratricopeptide (TPR) repeat protein